MLHGPWFKISYVQLSTNTPDKGAQQHCDDGIRSCKCLTGFLLVVMACFTTCVELYALTEQSSICPAWMAVNERHSIFLTSSLLARPSCGLTQCIVSGSTSRMAGGGLC